MRSQLWTEDDARRYDEGAARDIGPGELAATVDFLAALAGGEGDRAEALDGAPAGPPSALELAIGTGRVAVPLAERGVAVAGIELSVPMVDVLRTKASPESIPVTIGDMSTADAPPPGPGGFGLVYLVYNTISNLLTQEAQVDCFVNAARHLRPGGAFVIECFLPPLRNMPPGQTAAPFDISDDHLGFDTCDPVTQRLTSHHLTRRDGAWTRSASEHRYVWPSEMDLMARVAGLTLDLRIADWHGNPFTAESPSAISIWRR